MATSVFWCIFEAPVVQTFAHICMDKQTVCGIEVPSQDTHPHLVQFADNKPTAEVCPVCQQIMDAARKLVGVIFTETNGK